MRPMATLDTLPPERRAIIELLLRQRQGYENVASMLDMPEARVRELAREALASLAPGSARRVDDEWRDQVADYVLGQQTGPESKATRGHLKRSEPARTWVSSLIDSLDPLYGDGDRPEIPSADGGGAAKSKPGPRRGGDAQGKSESRRRGGAGAAAAGAGAAAGSAATRGGRPSATARPQRERSGTTTAERGAAADERARPGASGRTSELSPEARATVRRRRIIAGAAAAGAVAIVLAIVLITGNDDDETDRASNPPPAAQQQQQGPQAQLVGQAQLEAVGRSDAQGVAVIAQRGGEFQLLVQARGLEPSGRGAAYEVWLYNSRRSAQSLGGQVTDNDGNLQGAGPLPANFRNFRFVDISRERIDREAGHSGNSVLRIPVADLLRGPQPGAAAPGAAP